MDVLVTTLEVTLGGAGRIVSPLQTPESRGGYCGSCHHGEGAVPGDGCGQKNVR